MWFGREWWMRGQIFRILKDQFHQKAWFQSQNLEKHQTIDQRRLVQNKIIEFNLLEYAYWKCRNIMNQMRRRWLYWKFILHIHHDCVLKYGYFVLVHACKGDNNVTDICLWKWRELWRRWPLGWLTMSALKQPGVRNGTVQAYNRTSCTPKSETSLGLENRVLVSLRQ